MKIDHRSDADDVVRLDATQSVATIPSRRHFLPPLWRSLLLNAGAATLVVLILLSALAPVITSQDPTQANPAQANLAPSSSHLFGTDTNGMDVFARTLYAGRTDLSLAIVAIVIAMLVGLILGSTAAYVGRWVDEGTSRIAEMIQSIPLFLFALMVVAALGHSRPVLGAIIAIFYAPAFFKISRAVAVPLRQSDYVLVARTAGRSRGGIIVRHIIPNTIGPILGQLSVNMGFAIQLIAGLSFLGLGITVPQPEWGAMISIGADRFTFGQWWMAVFPGIFLFVSVMALDGIGRRLTESSEYSV